MKIAFFLTPKAEVAWIKSTSTVRQAIEKMEHYRYTSVPVLDAEGRYVGTLTEGDLLTFMKLHPEASLSTAEGMALADLPRRTHMEAVHVDVDIEQLFHRVIEQNFVPVIDDRGAFIGIVRRRKVLEFFRDRMLAMMGETS